MVYHRGHLLDKILIVGGGGFVYCAVGLKRLYIFWVKFLFIFKESN